MRRLVVLTLALAVGLTTVSCADLSGDSADGRTIRYQSTPGMVHLAEFADALGYLPGIRLKNVGAVQGGPQALLSLATGQVDLAGAFNGAMANVIANGAPLRAVISYYGSDRTSYGEVLVRTGSRVHDARDLIGKTVAVNTLGAQAEALLDTWFTRSGLSKNEIGRITLVPLPGINTEAALRQGQVEAALLSNSLRDAAVAGGGLRPVVRDTQLVGDFNGGTFAMTDDWLRAHPSVAREFVGGMARAAQWLATHGRRQMIARYGPWLSRHGRSQEIKSFGLWHSTGIATTGGLARPNDFTLWTSWLKQKGLLTGTVRPDRIYTNAYNPYATKEG